MGTCGGTAVELSIGWLTASGAMGESVSWGAFSALFGLLATDEQSLIAWLGEKVWIWSAVAIGVGLVIFVHELGHFLAAKMFGVKVEKFFVGFDVPISIFGIKLPRSFGRFRWGETEYGIGVIPLGGYVKMLGQDDDPRQAAAERERIRKLSDPEGETIDAPAPTLDPRSYPAKSVWQRMIIISAGVVMNMITSVIFAAIAFGFGVKYQPAVIGQTVPGYPAWEAGVEPGGRIVSVGGIQDDPKLHFMDMTLEILKAGIDTPEKPVSVSVQYGDQMRQYELQTRETRVEPKRPLIGIGLPIAAKLSDQMQAFPNTSASEVLEKSLRGAEIVAVDGNRIEPDPVVGVRLSNEISTALLRKRDQPIDLVFQTKEDGEVTVALPPQPYKSLGLDFAPGKVAALVTKGPAAEAGIRVGDEIIGFGPDADLVNAIDLPAQVARVDGTVQLRLRRGEGDDQETVDVTVTPSESYTAGSTFSGESGQIELASLGMTYRPTAVIDTADSETTGLQSGDVLRRVTVVWRTPEDAEALDGILSDPALKMLTEGWEIKDQQSLVALIENLQLVPTGTEVQLRATRGEDQLVVESQTVLSEAADQFWYDRGIGLSSVVLVHQADSLGEALSLGLRESQRKLGEVLGFLRMIFTGRVGFANIGGPVRIAEVASSAASVGITSLLMFLTLLSVNLAVLNFLPVPALDGGHMVFLIAEAVRGKPVDEELQAKITMVGVLALLCLMAFVLVNDWLQLST
jgi:regulator of sigma E protease